MRNNNNNFYVCGNNETVKDFVNSTRKMHDSRYKCDSIEQVTKDIGIYIQNRDGHFDNNLLEVMEGHYDAETRCVVRPVYYDGQHIRNIIEPLNFASARTKRNLIMAAILAGITMIVIFNMITPMM